VIQKTPWRLPNILPTLLYQINRYVFSRELKDNLIFECHAILSVIIIIDVKLDVIEKI